MVQPEAMDVSMIAMSPAFLIACFGALRLAKFNITASEQSSFFKGMPIPAVGLFVASFPLIIWQNPLGLASRLYSPWLLYLIIALLCWLMVSKVRFFKFMPSSWRLANIWPQLIIVIATVAAIPVLQSAAIALAFILYIILALIHKPKQA
jgi:CDP-diacylglycerol--serine O-phosphatidyltransferase